MRHGHLAVELKGLHFRWAKTESDCLSIDEFRLEMGERVFIHGPSGCGKSTLLSIIAGVCIPVSGHAMILDHPFHQLRARLRDQLRADHIGYVFQQFNLLPYLSVIDNVALPCQVSALRASRAVNLAGTPLRHAKQLLERMGIGPELWKRRSSALSVGQQQRVATARALIGAPELLVFDEPTSALDTALRETFMNLILDESRRTGSALVFVSHDEQIQRHFDRHVSLQALNRAALIGEVA